MKRTQQRHYLNSSADKWVQATLTGELITVMESEWLNILKVDRLAQSLDQLRVRCGVEERGDEATAQFEALLALHCVNYDAMSWSTRAGLPAALLNVFGLNAHTGPVLLGEDGWRQVEENFERRAQSASSPSSECKTSIEINTGPVGPYTDRCDILARALMQITKIGDRLRRLPDDVCLAAKGIRLRLGTWIIGDVAPDWAPLPRVSLSHPACTGLKCDDSLPAANSVDTVAAKTGVIWTAPRRPSRNERGKLDRRSSDDGDDDHSTVC